jgi:hypothetical protein
MFYFYQKNSHILTVVPLNGIMKHRSVAFIERCQQNKGVFLFCVPWTSSFFYYYLGIHDVIQLSCNSKNKSLNTRFAMEKYQFWKEGKYICMFANLLFIWGSIAQKRQYGLHVNL